MNLRSYIIRDELSGSHAALSFADQLGTTSLSRFDGIELSLRNASTVDVAGLAVIVRLYSQLEGSGRRLVLTDAPRHVESAFEELGLQGMLRKSRPRAGRFSMPPLRIPRRATA